MGKFPRMSLDVADVTQNETTTGKREQRSSIDDEEDRRRESARGAATCAHARLALGRSLGRPPDSSLTLPTAWLADRLDGGVVR